MPGDDPDLLRLEASWDQTEAGFIDWFRQAYAEHEAEMHRLHDFLSAKGEYVGLSPWSNRTVWALANYAFHNLMLKSWRKGLEIEGEETK